MIPPRKAQPMDSTSVAELRTAIRHKVQHSRDGDHQTMTWRRRPRSKPTPAVD